MLCDELNILRDAINTFGVDHQLDMAIEEMSELTKEVCKIKRNEEGSEYGSLDALSEEMADVIIMLEQLKIIFSNRLKVEEWVEKKMTRLANLVKDGDE